MKKLKIITAVVIVTLVIILVVLKSINLNQYKDEAVSIFNSYSDYKLQIEDDMSISLFPLGVQMSKVVLSERENSALLRAKSASVSLSLLSLLRGKIVVDYVEIDSPYIDLDAYEPSQSDSAFDAFIDKIIIDNGTFVSKKRKLKIEGVNAILEDFEISDDEFVLEFEALKIAYEDYYFSNVKLELDSTSNDLKVKNGSFTYLQSPILLDLEYNKKSENIKLKAGSKGLHVQPFAKQFLDEQMDGVVGVELKAGFDLKNTLASLELEAKVRGKEFAFVLHENEQKLDNFDIHLMYEKDEIDVKKSVFEYLDAKVELSGKYDMKKKFINLEMITQKFDLARLGETFFPKLHVSGLMGFKSSLSFGLDGFGGSVKGYVDTNGESVSVLVDKRRFDIKNNIIHVQFGDGGAKVDGLEVEYAKNRVILGGKYLFDTKFVDLSIASSGFDLQNVSEELPKELDIVGEVKFDANLSFITDEFKQSVGGEVEISSKNIELEYNKREFSFKDNSLKLVLEHGDILANDIEIETLDSKIAGSVEYHLGDGFVKLLLESEKIDTGVVSERFLTKKMFEGVLEGRIDVTFNERHIESSIDGNINFYGKNLLLHGYNLEQMLSEYEDTQKVKLIDVGAFFLAGPFGVLATKGLDGFLVFDGLNQGVSDIKQFSMAFDIKKGDFLAKDVAFSVGDKRVAFNGGFSLSKDEYQNFVFALVNKNGCPKYAQMIVGKLQSPTVSKSQALLSQVLNPITSLFSGAKDLIFGDECKMPFYDGVVKNP